LNWRLQKIARTFIEKKNNEGHIITDRREKQIQVGKKGIFLFIQDEQKNFSLSYLHHNDNQAAFPVLFRKRR
jgi:hypothetical protein